MKDNFKKEFDSILFGNEQIDFSIKYSERKDLQITVKPDLSVLVRAPEQKEYPEIIKKINHRAPWIIKQKDHFRRFHPLPSPKRYVSGETHLYLGRQYRLRINENGYESVKLVGGFFYIAVHDKSNTIKIEQLLYAWYRNHAEMLFKKRLAICHEFIKRFEIPRPEFTLRKMTRRWASCPRSGKILINPDLVKAPIHCIDYVIVHELCHLKEPNHSKHFYKLLSNCLPDWKQRKLRLEYMVV